MAGAETGQRYPVDRAQGIPDKVVIPEHERMENHRVAFVGATFLPKWQAGDTTGLNPDVTRGNQVLDNVKNLLKWGYQVVIIDGGSSPEFVQTLHEVTTGDVQIQENLSIHNQTGRTLSNAQRDGYEKASALSDVKAILTTQPEKPFDYSEIRSFTAPILSGDADMVIPNRTSQLSDYPPEQQYFELQGNRAMSEALSMVTREGRQLLHKGTILDIYNGTRIIRNDPEVIQEMMVQFDPKGDERLDFFTRLPDDAKAFLNPDQWFAGLYAPVAALLLNGKKVVSVDSNYQHPQEQTRQETGNTAFDRKRYQQYMAIVPYFYDYLTWLMSHEQKEGDWLVYLRNHVNKETPTGTAISDGKSVDYYLLEEGLQEKFDLPYLVTDVKDQGREILFLSSNIPPEDRGYIARHEIRHRNTDNGDCLDILQKELREVLDNEPRRYPVYVQQRFAFFNALVEGKKASPEMLPSIQGSRDHLARIINHINVVNNSTPAR